MKKQCIFLILFVVSFFGLLLAADLKADESTVLCAEPAVMPALIPALRIEGSLDFCDERVPIEKQDVRERLEKELLIVMWDRAQVVLWIKRSGRYMPVIEKNLKEEGLPDDLKYVAVVESALLGHVGSVKGARGFWQFMKGTGKQFDLTINSDKDERRNIFASTRAASRYLKELYGQFNSWTLASAAYNMGEFWLQEEIDAQKVNNYYQLYLPQETQRYIFKIIAVKLILSNPLKYGFRVEPRDMYPPLEFDQVTVFCPVDLPLLLVAEAAGTYYKNIKDMNPEFLGQQLAKGEHTVAVPKGTGEKFLPLFDQLVESWRAENASRVYIVQQGDSLSLIASRYDVPLQSLLRWNGLNPNNFIFPGKELVIYQ